MSDLVKDLLVNFLFVLIPLFFLQMISILQTTNSSLRFKTLLIAALPAISIVLCMLFPVKIYHGFYLDFRHIPFVMGILYGSYPFALFLLGVTLLARFLLGGIGFYLTLVIYSFLIVLILLIKKKYSNLPLKQKVLVTSLAIPVISSISLMIAAHTLNFHLSLSIQILYFLINAAGLLVAVFLWEVIRKVLEVVQTSIRMEKLEAVSHLAASISHEVRNPLTASKGFMQLLYDEVPGNTKKQYLDIAIQELERASEIIDAYLTFAKPESSEKELIYLSKEIEHIVQVIHPLANMNGVQLHLSIQETKNDIVSGAKKRLEQCMINLLKNSIEAMPDGGNLSIQLRGTSSHIHMTITDTGFGMTAEQIGRLGEPYFTTKETGTGLGMMVTYSIIKDMNGKISVKSEKGKGTCFSITLPAVQNMPT